MHTRSMKPILVGTLAVVVAAIVTGAASAALAQPVKKSSPPAQHVQQATAMPGLSDFPEVVRTLNEANADKPLAMPGLSDFPEVVRSLNDANVQKQLAMPGLSDFPEVARTLNGANAASHAKVASESDSGFDWSSAGVGVGIALGALSGFALVAVGMKRRKAIAAPA